MTAARVDATPMIRLATEFWKSKVLLTAVRLDLFSVLGDRTMTAADIQLKTGINDRTIFDFMDSLVAMELVDREGLGAEAHYSNTPESADLLNRLSPNCISPAIELYDVYTYDMWSQLGASLTSQTSSDEARAGRRRVSREFIADPNRLGSYLKGFGAIQQVGFDTLAEAFDFSAYDSVCDVGGGLAGMSIRLGQRHPHLQMTNFDIAPVNRLARVELERAGMHHRVACKSGDFNIDNLPFADICVLANILRDQNDDAKRMLVRKAFESTPSDGVMICFDTIIDDDRRDNIFALLQSLEQAISQGEGSCFTRSQLEGWCLEAGFKRVVFEAMAGSSFAAYAYKH